MDQQDLIVATTCMNMTTKVALEDAVKDCLQMWDKGNDSSNMQASMSYELFKQMLNLKMSQSLSSRYKKMYDLTKKNLDEMMEKNGVNISSEPGTTKVIYENNNLQLIKKENMPSNTCSVTDLKIELAKAGVDSSTIKAAEEAASKQKKGNVYYSISTM